MKGTKNFLRFCLFISNCFFFLKLHATSLFHLEYLNPFLRSLEMHFLFRYIFLKCLICVLSNIWKVTKVSYSKIWWELKVNWDFVCFSQTVYFFKSYIRKGTLPLKNVLLLFFLWIKCIRSDIFHCTTQNTQGMVGA